MKLNNKPEISQSNHLFIPIYKQDLGFAEEILNLKSLVGFSGDFGEIYTFQKQESKIFVGGLGDKDKSENVSNVSRKVVSMSLKLEGTLSIVVDHLEPEVIENIIIGANLGKYQIGLYKEKIANVNLKQISIISKNKKTQSILKRSISLSESIMNAMDLVNQPSNIKTPYYLADYALKSGKVNGYKVKVIKGKDLEKQKLHAVYAVGKASENPPAFIIMDYNPKTSNKNMKTIGLVGKGISFDTGGLSIKPSTNMHYMKCDMGGAAAVIGMMEVAAKLNLQHRVIGIVPTAENAVSGNAYRPGDIIKTYSGKSIEVIDTDAEGRIVLADGISYLVKNYKTDYLIDLATLTGSCVATLGYFAAGLFTKNDELATKLSKSGHQTKERVWPLPMWDDYKPYMGSDMADIKNLSSAPVAGAITAAKFLEEFTEGHAAFAHLDVAGVVFTDNDIFKTRTATGYGVRLLCNFIENL
jgi:leucyl aminopeptidase